MITPGQNDITFNQKLIRGWTPYEFLLQLNTIHKYRAQTKIQQQHNYCRSQQDKSKFFFINDAQKTLDQR